MIGITSYGAYIPRLRLDRMAIFQGMGWFAPAIMMVAQGGRPVPGFDDPAVCRSPERRNRVGRPQPQR
jgi:3-hydroxy-3-methylglutaryl CoA synthase